MVIYKSHDAAETNLIKAETFGSHEKSRFERSPQDVSHTAG